MDDLLRSWLAQIGRIDGVETLIWIGAGDAKHLPPPDVLGARRILLIEPNPLHLPDLERLAAQDPRVSVHSVAIHSQDGRAHLNRFNWPALASVSMPEGLEATFPGLRKTEKSEIATVTMNTLLAREKLDFSTSTVLRLDAPGIEGIVLTSVFEATPKAALHILLRCPIAPFHAGGQPAAALRASLESHDFRLHDRDREDADFVDHWFRHDADLKIMRHERDAAHAEIAALDGQLADVINARDILKTDLDELRERYRQKWRDAPSEADGRVVHSRCEP